VLLLYIIGYCTDYGSEILFKYIKQYEYFVHSSVCVRKGYECHIPHTSVCTFTTSVVRESNYFNFHPMTFHKQDGRVSLMKQWYRLEYERSSWCVFLSLSCQGSWTGIELQVKKGKEGKTENLCKKWCHWGTWYVGTSSRILRHIIRFIMTLYIKIRSSVGLSDMVGR
jgi:hypothetical protein